MRVDVTQMSDGYRSILSLTFELIRQMVRSYGHAYGTELFGKNITQSQSGQQLTEKLATLNMKSFKTKLSEKELTCLFLDTKDTFKFVPYKDEAEDIRRAEYTIEVLGLNSRSHLVRARKVAFDNFKARLYEYVHKKEAGETEEDLLPLIDSLRSEHHQTVWHEMIRQRKLHPEVDDLLNRAREALTWI